MISAISYTTTTGTETFEVRTGEDAFFGVAGRAWCVATPVGAACVPMGQAPWVGIEDGIRLAGVTRYCKSAIRAQERESSRLFGEFRTAARGFLTHFGPVRSGIASCGEFICERNEA